MDVIMVPNAWKPMIRREFLRRRGAAKIRSGQFAREFMREMKVLSRRPGQLLLDAEQHPIGNLAGRLRGLMAWREKI
jgi:ketol-acid reductoisomerase